MQPDHIPYIGAKAVEQLLPMPALIEAAGRAFLDRIAAPPRLVLSDGGPDWLAMPCLGPDGELVCKLVRADLQGGRNAAIPTISGALILLSPHGRTEAVIDAAAVTARRTAAIAAYATDILAPADATVLALFGTGALASSHVQALHVVRPLSAIRVVGRSPERTRAFVEGLREQGFDATVETPASALDGADIVVTVTTATDPVFADASIRPGMHINALGSYVPVRREIAFATVARARVVVEVPEHAWQEAGDLIQPLEEELIDHTHLAGDLSEGDGLRRIRTDDPSAITLFKSVGHAALDLAAVALLRPGLVTA